MSTPRFVTLTVHGLLSQIFLYLDLNFTASLYDIGENTLSPRACIMLSTK